MKPYLQTLALVTLLLSKPTVALAQTVQKTNSKHHINHIDKANSSNMPSHDKREDKNLADKDQAHKNHIHQNEAHKDRAESFHMGIELMPRYNHSGHNTSARLPLLGVPTVPEAGWLWSGSKFYADAKWHPATPLIDKTQAHVGVSWSDVENKLVADHVFLNLQKHHSAIKIGRYPPFAQPRMLGMSSLLLSNILADDHWHVDGVQLSHIIDGAYQDNMLPLAGKANLTLGAYTEGAYLGDSAETNNGIGKVATVHLGLAWQDGLEKMRHKTGLSHKGVALHALYAPDMMRVTKQLNQPQTHTHGSVLNECKQASASCFDGQAGLLWLHGFWHNGFWHKKGTGHAKHSHLARNQKALYGVDTILALQKMQGKLNTPISSTEVNSHQWHALVDVFYQPYNTKYSLRAETMQIQHDIKGINARQTAKNVGIANNSHNPWRIGIQADVPLATGMMLSPAVFWDDSRQGQADVVYSLGLHYQLKKIW